MKILKIVAGLMSLLAISACMSTTEMKDPTVVDPLVGKRLVTDKGAVFIINSDGTMGGTLRGESIVGTYSADASEVCSTYSAPDFLTGKEFCSTPSIDGDTVVFNRRDGTKSPVYNIES